MKKIRLSIAAIAGAAALLSSCASTNVQPSPSAGPEDEENITFPEELAAVRNPVPEGQIILLDSFEDGNFWQPLSDTTTDGSIETDLSSSWFSEGEAGGCWTFSKASKTESASFYCDALSYRKWEEAKFIIADINNTTDSTIKVRLVIESSGRKSLTESVSIGKGDNRNIRFLLDKYLSDENGSYVDSLPDASNIRRVTMLIERAPKGSIFVDNIRLVK